MNELYLVMYDITYQAKIIEGQLLLRLKENKYLIKRMEATEIAQANVLSKLREELSSRDRKIKALLDNKADLFNEVANLKAKAWVAEEYLMEAMLARDVEFAEAAKEEAKEVVVKFKDSEKFASLFEKKYEAGHDTSYDARVVDIFYNIWLKHRDIDYKFLGEEFMKVKDQWVENERLGDLNSAPPSSPLAPGTKGNVIIAEVGPSMVPKQ